MRSKIFGSLKRAKFIFVLSIAAVLILAAYGFAGDDKKSDRRVMRSITVYTTLPAEHAAVLADEYENLYRVRVDFVPLSENDMQTRLSNSLQNAEKPEPAMLLVGNSLLQKAAALGYIKPYVSEQNDAVTDNFKDYNGFWTGVWYDPTVFAVNADYLKTVPFIPDSWTDLSRAQNIRIGMTDFMAADSPKNLLFGMIGQFGDQAAYDIWRGIHPNVVQYAKYLSTPVRQAGMGEVDIAVAPLHESLRYMREGYPLKIVYPADGTSFMLTGTGIVIGQDAETELTAKTLADWLLTDEAQNVLQRNGFYFLPTNPDTISFKSFAGKNLLLWGNAPNFSADEKDNFVDRWMKYIRFR